LVDFRYPDPQCTCGGALKVQKTQTKRVVSLSGTYIARRVRKRCGRCGRFMEDPALLQWVPHRCNTAWDVLVFVGRRLFEDCHSVRQVHSELAARDVVLSESQIVKLGRKFILYLALAHRRATPHIREKMTRSGGYILHLDAVHQDDAPALMSGIDGLSRLVLANVKIPSENSEQIVPFLKKLKNDYGHPIACVHDMGTGICKSVSSVFPGSKDFICHFHFLRDAGKDLIEPAYRRLRSCLRKHKVSTRLSELARQARQALADRADEANAVAKSFTQDKQDADPGLTTLVVAYALALWCLQGKHTGDGYGFPFDRPLLSMAERLLVLLDHLPWLLQSLPGDNAAGNRLFVHLARKTIEVIGDADLEKSVKELRWRCRLFDQLRQAMRIATVAGKDGLNDNGQVVEMDSIREGVGRFRNRLDTGPQLSADPLCVKLAEQIDKYADKLFADPIQVHSPSGPVVVYPQRTNNILEQFFRAMRRDHRRRTGDNRMHRALQTMLADTPLVKNLSNPEYMEILLDGKPDLESLFADLDRTLAPGDLVLHDTSERILPGFKLLAKMPDLPFRIAEKTKTMAVGIKSNQIVWP
jgi:hypothetical protein